MGDIESVAYIAGLPGSLGSPALIPDLVSLMTRMISEHIQNFCEECNNSAGTTKILNADGVELSLSALLRKYYST